MLLVFLSAFLYRQTFNFSSYNPDTMLLSFGFHKGASFEVDASVTPSTQSFALLLANETESQALYRHRIPLQKVCANVESVGLSATSDGQTNIHWTGTIPEDGVYNLFLINCGSGRSGFSLSVNYQNPNSHLDSRDDSAPYIYWVLSMIQGVLGTVWIMNGILFMNFRIPLHTIFCVLPMTRAVSLWVTSTKWNDLQTTGTYPFWKDVCQTSLEFIYYTLMFTGIAAACAGFCIFRNKFTRRDKREIVVSSALLTGGILATQHCPNFGYAIFGLGFTICNLIWYFKHSIINLIIATNLMKLMRKDPHVYAKVKLSRNFVVSSFSIIIGTLVLSLGAAGMDMQLCVYAVILESGLIVCTLLQLKFFMFRKQYSGDAEAPREQQTLVEFPMIIEPRASYLVCMTTRV